MEQVAVADVDPAREGDRGVDEDGSQRTASRSAAPRGEDRPRTDEQDEQGEGRLEREGDGEEVPKPWSECSPSRKAAAPPSARRSRKSPDIGLGQEAARAQAASTSDAAGSSGRAGPTGTRPRCAGRGRPA